MLPSTGFDLVIEHHYERDIGTGKERNAYEEFEYLDDLLRSLARYVQDTWVAAVTGAILPGMTQAVRNPEYANSIQVVRRGNLQYAVVTNYPRANEIEEGKPSYDMKPGLLASPKAKHGADGSMYITVPFRHFTQGPDGAPRMSARSDGSDTMPPDIHEYTKRFGTYNEKTEGQRTKVPELRAGGTQIGGVNAQALVRGSSGPMSAPYTWKSGQYAGLTRTQTSGGASRYFTFRRVSSRRLQRLADGRGVWVGSDPNSWIHPGKPANPISQAVKDFTTPEIAKVIGKLVGESIAIG